MSLSKERETRAAVGSLIELIVADATTIYAGALVAVDATGKAVPASDASGLTVVGRAEWTRTAGSRLVVRRGWFLYDNATDGDAITLAHLGSVCYVASDSAVTAATGTYSVVAGIVRGIEGTEVIVDTLGGAAGATGAKGATGAAGADGEDGASASDIAAAYAAWKVLNAEGTFELYLASLIA